MLWLNEILTGTVRRLVVISGHLMICLPILWTQTILLAITEIVFFCQMLKLWYFDYTFKDKLINEKYDRTKFFLWNPYYLRAYRENSLDIVSSLEMRKRKMIFLEEARKS